MSIAGIYDTDLLSAKEPTPEDSVSASSPVMIPHDEGLVGIDARSLAEEEAKVHSPELIGHTGSSQSTDPESSSQPLPLPQPETHQTRIPYDHPRKDRPCARRDSREALSIRAHGGWRMDLQGTHRVGKEVPR